MLSIIPTSMFIVTTSTLALSARRLVKDHVIVHRLTAVEELAGMGTKVGNWGKSVIFVSIFGMYCL